MIREANLEDAKDIANIKISAWQSAYKGIISHYYLVNMDILNEEEKVKSIINNEDEKIKGKYYVYIADNALKTLGYCNIERDFNKEYNTDATLHMLYVNPDYTNMGIGTQIFEYLKKELKEEGCNSILTTCFENNSNTRKFYEKNGGSIVGEQREKVGNQIINQIIYKLNI